MIFCCISVGHTMQLHWHSSHFWILVMSQSSSKRAKISVLQKILSSQKGNYRRARHSTCLVKVQVSKTQPGASKWKELQG